MAAGFVIGGSVFLLLTVFDSLTNLNSVDMRDEITRMLNSPTGEGLGITMSQALTSMRVGLMVAGACAAAAAVLGIYVLKPNRGARLALSILAVPILLTAPLTGGITGALVVAAPCEIPRFTRWKLLRYLCNELARYLRIQCETRTWQSVTTSRHFIRMALLA